MVKARRGVASKSSERRKGHTTPARSKVAKRTAPKKAKSKVRKVTRLYTEIDGQKKTVTEGSAEKGTKATLKTNDRGPGRPYHYSRG